MATSWISRAQTAHILGCSLSTVRRYEGKGLTFKKDKDGAYLYDRDDAERLRSVILVKSLENSRKPKNIGEMARRVFQCFEIGMTIPEIVMKWGVDPGRVQEWLDTYNGVEKTLTEKEKAELEIKRAQLRLKQERQQLIAEKHLTVQRNRRDPLTGRLRADWGE